MNSTSQLFGTASQPKAFDTTATNNTNQTSQNGKQKTPSNQLTADSFITLLTTQLQAQDPLNPLDPNQMVSELTTMNTLQQIIQVRQDLDSLLAIAKTPNGSGSGNSGNGSGSGNSSAAADRITAAS